MFSMGKRNAEEPQNIHSDNFYRSCDPLAMNSRCFHTSVVEWMESSQGKSSSDSKRWRGSGESTHCEWQRNPVLCARRLGLSGMAYALARSEKITLVNLSDLYICGINRHNKVQHGLQTQVAFRLDHVVVEKPQGNHGAVQGTSPEKDTSIHWRIKRSKGTILPFRFPKRRSLDAIPVTIKIGQDTTKTSTQAEIIFLGRDCLRFRIPTSIVDPEQFKDSEGPESDTMVEFAGIRGDLLD
ncbi:hypothetical protein E2P81_ATG00232 [Venturia nashicola]|nr:hypothetical protein E2P81_ATG00232 [Venturia nashicola]